jgi:predicted HD superfamily hydrolase involved in NAD metabolism
MSKSVVDIKRPNSLSQELSRLVSFERFRHCLQVAQTALELAVLHGVSPAQAYVAGLLHDAARGMTDERLLKVAREAGIKASSVERQVPVLLHGKIGALVAERRFGVDDSSVLEAVALHVTGAPKLEPLAELLFVADYVEPGRCFPGVKTARSLARESIKAAADYKFLCTAHHLQSRGAPFHPLFAAALVSRGLKQNER